MTEDAYLFPSYTLNVPIRPEPYSWNTPANVFFREIPLQNTDLEFFLHRSLLLLVETFVLNLNLCCEERCCEEIPLKYRWYFLS